MQHSEGTLQGADGLELYLQSWRPDETPVAALALVHGLGEHSGRYQNLVDYFVTRGYAIHSFDLRGHGRSPGPRGYFGSWDDVRGDVGSLLRHVVRTEGDRPLFLVGHSLGGLIVLEFVLHDGGPAVALDGVVVSAPGLSTEGFSPLLLTIARILSRIRPAMVFKTGLDATGLSRDPAVVTAYQQDPLVHDIGTPRLTTESMAAIKRTLASVDEWRLPLLMIYGTADRIVPPAPSRRFFEQAPIEDKQLIEYEGGYHESHNDIEAGRVLGDVEGWLARHRK